MWNKIISLMKIIIITLLCFFVSRAVFKYFKNKELYLSQEFKESVDVIKLKSDIVNVPVYVLNMTKNANRKKHMEKLLNNLGFRYVIFVTPIETDKAIQYYKKINVDIKPSTASRTLSTFKVFEMAKKYDKFIISEDDINIFSEKPNVDDVYEASKSYDYDLLFFEMCHINCLRSKKLKEYLYNLYNPVCNGFVLYTNKSIDIIKKNYFGKEDNQCLDEHIAKMSNEDKLKSYGYPIFRQDPRFNSDIETSPRYTDKSIKFDKLCYI